MLRTKRSRTSCRKPESMKRTSGEPSGSGSGWKRENEACFCARENPRPNDKEAAPAAGYSLSVAENTKPKIWAKPQVSAAWTFRRLE